MHNYSFLFVFSCAWILSRFGFCLRLGQHCTISKKTLGRFLQSSVESMIMEVSSMTKSFQSELNRIEMKWSDQIDAEVNFSCVNCGGLSKSD